VKASQISAKSGCFGGNILPQEENHRPDYRFQLPLRVFQPLAKGWKAQPRAVLD